MRVLAILILCMALTACQFSGTAAAPTATATAPAAEPAVTREAIASSIKTAAPGATPVLTEDAEESEATVEITLCDEVDWELPGGRIIRAELRNIWIEDESNSFNDSYLHLTLSGEDLYREYRLADEGPIPPYYLYPCNITGGGQDLLISKGTTSNGIRIWLYELFTLNGDNDLVLVDKCDYYTESPCPQIPVRKESTDDRVKIFAEATILNDEILLIDWPMPVDPVDWIGGGIHYLDEGKSTAELLRHQEIVPEDIDGDGKDELRVQFFLGEYKAWYGHVTAWFSYADGEWETVKVLFAIFDENEYLYTPSAEIPAREIVTPLVLPDMTLAEIAESEGKTHWGEGREYISAAGDSYRVGYQSDKVSSVSTEDPARFEIKGLRVGSPVCEMYGRLGDPCDLNSHTYFYTVDDGTLLLIWTEGNRIARFTLARQ